MNSYQKSLSRMLCFCCSATLFLTLLAVVSGCDSGSTIKQKNYLHPLQLGIVKDASGSVVQNGVPELQISHIDRVISILNKRGGTMAFGLINENSFEPLDRLAVLPVVGRLDERAQYNTQNQGATKEFRTAIEPKISSNRGAKTTDFYGAMRRFSLFFDEPSSADAEKIMLAVTDGIDTRSKHQTIKNPLPNGVRVLAIGMEKDAAIKLFGDNVSIFESIDSAIDSIANVGGESKNANTL